ncbi:uncharacterized protein LOC111018462 isoform X2 [Momordica charantia]|uniref:Uncharacterized protein LOC111018462 isoform X2 n=1 Tax=Momordica charantia TaxID=3673 RepID=A0A6J1D7Z3_MOMCH|nr:uncharacterized protein LOC111018462 isoform X2 [Momordica charantia]
MEMASPRPVAIPNLPAVNSNSSWWVDSCFNAHVTTDSSQFTNATNATEYSGEDHISVGSGQSLPISHRQEIVLTSVLHLGLLYFLDLIWFLRDLRNKQRCPEVLLRLSIVHLLLQLLNCFGFVN